MEKMGIENLKKVVVFFALLGSAVDKSTRDGLDLDDIGNMVTPLMKAPEAFGALDQAKMEVADLDEAEIKELHQAVAENLDLVDDEVEVVVERALSAAIEIYSIVEAIKDLRA